MCLPGNFIESAAKDNFMGFYHPEYYYCHAELVSASYR